MTLEETNFPARDRLNDRLVREVRVTGPASYPAGGDPINAPSTLGMAEVFGVYGALGSDAANTVIIPVLDYADQTVRFYDDSLGTEVVAGSDISTFVGTLLFTGKG